MHRVSIGTAVILLAAFSGIGARVAAKGAEKPNSPAGGSLSAYLKPVSMDEQGVTGYSGDQRSISRSMAPSTRPT